jgi:hypothetical protein
MIKKDLDSDEHKPSSTQAKDTAVAVEVNAALHEHVVIHKHNHHVANAAAGDLPNGRVKFCYTCKNRGYPHEAIEFENIPGRLRADGTNEVAGWQLRNYFDGLLHEHRPRREVSDH